jgi:hypothetical protein
MADSKNAMAEERHLLAELESLLQRQIDLAHKGNISGAERLAQQAGLLVDRIVRTGILQLPELNSRSRQLQKLYEDLRLAVTTQKADTAAKLSHVRKGRRTARAYRTTI